MFRMRSSSHFPSEDKRWGMLEYSTLTGILSGHRYLPVIRQRVVTGYNLAPSIGDSMSAVVLLAHKMRTDTVMV